MNADLNASGTQSLDRDLLNMLARNGAMMATTALSCAVGRGSSAQLLLGSARTAAMTSSTVTDWNLWKEAPRGVSRNDGGGASTVADHTPATCHRKNDGTVKRRCHRAAVLGRGPAVLRWSAIVDAVTTSRRRSSPSRTAYVSAGEARYSRRLEYQALVASGVRRRRDGRSRRRTAHFDCQHSWSNQGSEGCRRIVTVFAGMRLSSSAVSSSENRSASWSTEQSDQLSDWHNRDADTADRRASTLSKCQGRRTTEIAGVTGRAIGTDHWSR